MTKAEIKAELAEIIERLDQLNAKQEVNNTDLKEHMSRTALLEAAVKAQREYFEFRVDNSDARIKEQETALNGLPTKVLQFVSILGGITMLVKALL